MKKRKNKLKNNLIIWTPRVLIILYIIFLSLFAFDEPLFSLGFLIHMIPSLVLIIVAVVAWYKPRPAGVFFIMIAIIFTMFFNTYKEPIALLVISLPLLVTGVLFYISPKRKN